MASTPLVALTSALFFVMIVPVVHFVIGPTSSSTHNTNSASEEITLRRLGYSKATSTDISPSARSEVVQLQNRQDSMVPSDRILQEAGALTKGTAKIINVEAIDAEFSAEASLWSKVKNAKCSLDWGPVVQQQLSNWQGKGFTYEQVQYFCAKAVFRLSYVNGEMRMGRYKLDNKNIHRMICGFWLIYMATKRAAARGHEIPSFELSIQPGDTAFSTQRVQWLDAAPLLSNIKCGGASVSFPLTFHDQFGNGFGHMSLTMYDEAYRNMLNWEIPDVQPAWTDKKQHVFFAGPRGAGTRGNRSKLFGLKSKKLHVTDKPTKVAEMAGYQGNIYAYGHCGWSRRIHELAMMRTVVYMEDSICREFFHGLFQPGVDHIAVNEDFSDLVEKVEEAAKQPSKSKVMAERWYDRGTEMFGLPCVLDYVELLLREYAKLQRFTPEYHPTWPQYFPNQTHDFFRSKEAELSKDSCRPPEMFNGNRAHRC